MTPATDRMKSEERREAILEAAIAEFAVAGFAGATTADIAKRAGISQPYVFRFFPTKKELFLAAVDRCKSRILRDWEHAVAESRRVAARVPRPNLRGDPPGATRRADGHAPCLRLGRGSRTSPRQCATTSRSSTATSCTSSSGMGMPGAYEEAARFMARGFVINAAMAIGLESALTTEEWAGICPAGGVARIEDRLEDTPAA